MSKNTKKKSGFKGLEKLGVNLHIIRVLDDLTMTFEKVPAKHLLLASELKILKSHGFQEGETLETIRYNTSKARSISEIEQIFKNAQNRQSFRSKIKKVFRKLKKKK